MTFHLNTLTLGKFLVILQDFTQIFFEEAFFSVRFFYDTLIHEDSTVSDSYFQDFPQCLNIVDG